MMTVDDLNIPLDAIFGMLLAAEGGASLHHMGHVYGLEASSLRTLLDRARNGECGRLEASTGDAKVPMDKGRGHGPIVSDRQEVLVQRWMRRIARHLNRHGVITAAEIRGYLGEGREQHASVSLDALRHQFDGLGLTFVGKSRKGTLPERLELDFQSQQTLAAIIADGWKIEVKR